MNKKLIIFDMGNTLLDFHKGGYTDEEKDEFGIGFMKDYLNINHDLLIKEEVIKKEFLDKWYGDFYKRELLIELDVIDYIKDFLSAIGQENLEVNYYNLMKAFYKKYMDKVLVNEGVKEALLHFNGQAHIGVISNCILFDDLYKEVFKSVGLDQYIDKYVFSYSRQIRKPDKRLFNEMMDHFKVDANNTYMVGDSLKADIKSAKELGMTTLWFNKSDDISEFADYKIAKLNETIVHINL